jgi:GxxExxY protein
MLNHPITQQILGAAIEIARRLDPGLGESAREKCLGHELSVRQWNFEKDKPIPVVYKEARLDSGHRPEMLVKGRIVAEQKSVDGPGPIHEAIILTYLGLSGDELQSSMNFMLPCAPMGSKYS